MDGIKERGKIIVIGATNIPEVIDPALRRPGRFDREIAIGIPDKEGRLDILEIHTRAMPLAPDLDLRKIAEITHGFVGADLAGLCREAAMKELRTIFPDIDFAGSRIPYGKLESLQVTEAHFMDALGEIEPSALREVLIETPDIRWSDVGGLEEVKKVLQDTIEYPLKHGYLFEYAKTAPPKGILLFGPPGTGKTLVAKAVARESEVNFISVRGPQLMSMWVGETERGIRETFRKAKQAKPCIIFFDELDAIASRRSILDTSRVTERAISQFCTELDGIEELKGVVVIGATNRKDLIDEALLRPGRFDFQLEFPIPDQKTKLEIFKIHTRGKPLAKDLDFKKLIELLGKGATGADIESLCRAASILAIREFIQKKVKDKSKFLIEMRYFEEVLKSGKREEE